MINFIPLEQKLVCLFIKQYKKNKGLKNCPNNGVFYFAYNYINFNPIIWSKEFLKDKML